MLNSRNFAWDSVESSAKQVCGAEMAKAMFVVSGLWIMAALAGCANQDTTELGAREDFAICFSPGDGAQKFKYYLMSFAQQEGMSVLDRSKKVEKELRSLEDARDVLESTVGPLILMTVEKENELRISITNASLGNDLSLSFRYKVGTRPNEATRLLEQVTQEHRVMTMDEAGHDDQICES